MREIKFRAWKPSEKRMWYKDSKTIDGDEIIFKFFAGGIGWGVYDSKVDYRIITGDPNAVFNTPGKLMQYTGLKDKNGKDIYEDDVLQDESGRIWKIVWSDRSPGFYMELQEKKKKRFDGRIGPMRTKIQEYISATMAVIGNIYEHPHLLTPTT